jgi:hypothetical protein
MEATMKAFDEQLVANVRPAPHKQTRDGRKRTAESDATRASLGQSRILHLQRTAGNAAVAQLLAGEETEGDGTSVRDVVGKGGGDPLPGKLRRNMEKSFGLDFSDVRLHTGTTAESSARSVQASAYTVGNEIVLGADSASIESDAGRRTLAHELTHVVQQRSGPVEGTDVGGGIQVSNPSDRFEQQAEQVADRVSSDVGTSPAMAGESSSGGFSLQREEDEGEDAVRTGVAVQREEDEEDEPETEE